MPLRSRVSCPRDISYGRFCWNQESQVPPCQFYVGPGTQNRLAISCKLTVEEGFWITEMAQEIRYGLTRLGLNPES
jgi:hypothetical protein